VKVIHTSPKFMGQVYIPEVNWILMVMCVFITAVFKTTTYIGSAYGKILSQLPFCTNLYDAACIQYVLSPTLVVINLLK
jgi:KUP system potassium uptake protein